MIKQYIYNITVEYIWLRQGEEIVWQFSIVVKVSCIGETYIYIIYISYIYIHMYLILIWFIRLPYFVCWLVCIQ